MIALDDLRLLLAIADHGNLSAAARQLGLLPATASAALKRIEQALGARLFERSTRSVRPTDAGATYLASCRQALDQLDGAAERLAGDRGRFAGPVRLAAPSDFGRSVLRPWIDAFQEQHPAIRVTLLLGDHLADLLRDDVDCALRYGALADSAFIRRRMAPSGRVLVAAPAYLEARGTPASPEELRRHRCLVLLRGREPLNRWRFAMADGERTVAVEADRVTDDGALLRDWALAGVGIAYKSWLDVAADVAAGRLHRVLPGWTREDTPLQLLFASGRHRPLRVDALADHLAARIAAYAAAHPFAGAVPPSARP
ncbi:LysR family transcriptional regulator [Azospirillum picis]|uniref:DNA-binding transcriptional LysR family regulator n=1 Tax=Azospirillum picis TaxID=488438 RepID=A0ABU0MM73_9PROT|nr:LysR family transcriptional regulator [Azospirillum picis]MBP2300532.1 DNA-binding transcriptional LysR family regulator [Azospirillum picis]MDQ0534501.1 DNA-binding transcriptional LysR family regulator [Azospirillum picis]